MLTSLSVIMLNVAMIKVVPQTIQVRKDNVLFIDMFGNNCLYLENLKLNPNHCLSFSPIKHPEIPIANFLSFTQIKCDYSNRKIN